MNSEEKRLQESKKREKNWKRWGPYLSEREWATVREDYSREGDSWEYFTHDQARSRVYRWGEDGLLGITDRECRLCFALALWNGKDPILKERLFGLTQQEGNHGEDVKECYFYLDSTPTHSYMKGLYKYPQRAYPYEDLKAENRRRGLSEEEFELKDTGIFSENRYFDLFVEYAKHSPDDILIKITVINRGPQSATLHLLPSLWFRNTWDFGSPYESLQEKPALKLEEKGVISATHQTLGRFLFFFEEGEPLFTENQTNLERLYGIKNNSAYVKDAFHRKVIEGARGVINPKNEGTKCAIYSALELEAGESRVIKLRLTDVHERSSLPLGLRYDEIFAKALEEANIFYNEKIPSQTIYEEKNVMRQAYAGLLWTKQFYYYVVEEWFEGDPKQPPPPLPRKKRNHEWRHLYARDIISVPDKWEYPWFAAWDLCFHLIPFAKIDPDFAKEQMTLFLREWYMHPNGQQPAYEFNFSDVNPPVHAWSAWRIYKMTGKKGERDLAFLESTFQKLLMNFTWWLNRKDLEGNNLFSGGFLGLDNIGVFNRSQLPEGIVLRQADATAWMAFYCLNMLAIALELSLTNAVYQDIASKFFEHFVHITDAINAFGKEQGLTGLWDKEDGFYYDHLRRDGKEMPLKTRSLVGLIPLIAVEILEESHIEKLPGFAKRMNWFLKYRKDLHESITYCEAKKEHRHRLLAIPSKIRLQKVLKCMLDESEFLSPYGLRSLSKIHGEKPYILRSCEGKEHRVDYVPGVSNSFLFGGNSNWRGPIWFPINFLIIEALEKYHHYYGDELLVEFPTHSGNMCNLKTVADELSKRLCNIFLPESEGRRPCHGNDLDYQSNPYWKDYVLFYEYFHGEHGQGLGANHQTGWTALVAKLMEDLKKC